MRKFLLLTVSHAAAAVFGFAAGIYVLPILVAPAGPTPAEVEAATGSARYKAEFRRDLKGSDILHWGEGAVSITPRSVAFKGKLAPGPDYKLYLVPEFVDTKEDFLRVKDKSARVGDIRTFENFIVDVPDAVDVSRFTTVLVWCERFSMFITAARYR